MRYLLISLILILAGCNQQSTTDNKSFLEPYKAASDKPSLDFPKTEQSAAEAPQPAKKGLAYDLAMLRAHCLGRAYGLNTKDITFVPKCMRDKSLAIYREYHPEYIDIVQYGQDETIVLLEELQKHKITQSKFQAKLSALQVKTHDMLDRREREILQDNAAYEQPPIIIQQQINEAPAPLATQAPSIHCDSTMDKAGNGSMNCY